MPAGLPFDVYIDFGDYRPLEGYAELEGTSLSWIEDHGELGVGLLIWQFREKPRLEAMLRALLVGAQVTEDVVWQVLTERSLDTAVGVQLDRIGDLVDFPRAGFEDDAYRALLRAQVLVLKSQGRWSDLAAILEVVGVTLSLARFSEPGIAAIQIDLGEPFTGALDGDDVFRLLAGTTATSSSKRNQRGAKPACVRLILTWPTVDVDETFVLADTTPAADAARGCGDAVADAVGGYLATTLASTERL